MGIGKLLANYEVLDKLGEAFRVRRFCQFQRLDGVNRIETAVCWTIAIVLQPVAVVLMFLSFPGAISLGGSHRGAKQVAALAQIAAFVVALNTYKEEIGDFPTTSQGLEALWKNPGIDRWRGPYLDREIPNDPWGRDYLYHYRVLGIPEVVSLGSEGKPGATNISSLTMTASLRRPPLTIPLLSMSVFLISALVFFGYPLLPRLLRKLNTRTSAC